jgi:hypothetical protein
MFYSYKIAMKQSTSKTVETVDKRSIISIDFQGLIGQFINLEGLTLLGSLLLIVVILNWAGKGKGKLTSGRLAGTAEKLEATKPAAGVYRAQHHSRPFGGQAGHLLPVG